MLGRSRDGAPWCLRFGAGCLFFSLLLSSGPASAAVPVRSRYPRKPPVQSVRTPYAEVRAHLNNLAKGSAGKARVFTLGESDSGQPIEGLEIGDGAVRSLVVAAHHGNEYASVEVAKALATSLAAHPIAGQTVFVIPVLNVSGFNESERWERSGSGGAFDPNRDYPGPCGSEGPFRLKSTTALARFLEERSITTAASLHSFLPAVTFPWGVAASGSFTHYDGVFRMLAESATLESGYPIGTSGQLVYKANGTFEDFAFWRHGIWSFLFELGSSHSPSPEQLSELIGLNVPGLRRMLEQAPGKRAERHALEGKCEYSALSRDPHDE